MREHSTTLLIKGSSNKGLQHHAAAKRFQHHGRLDERTVQTANVLRQGQCQPSQLRECLPVVTIETFAGRGLVPSLLEAVVIANVALHAITQHQLLFGKIEIHVKTLRVRKPVWQ
jgi:hypothetical protein